MIINVGDKIVGNHGRTGEIINIGIATEKTDIAAENYRLGHKINILK